MWVHNVSTSQLDGHVTRKTPGAPMASHGHPPRPRQAPAIPRLKLACDHAERREEPTCVKGIKSNTLIQQEWCRRHAGHASHHRHPVVGAVHRLQLGAPYALPLVALVRRPLQLPLNCQHRVALLGAQRGWGPGRVDPNNTGRARVLATATLQT